MLYSGTVCAYLVDKYPFALFHSSVGDLLRAEQNRKDSEYGELIQNHIKEGRIVPIEITCKLIENAMKKRLKCY